MVSLEKSADSLRPAKIKESYCLLRDLMNLLRSVCLQRYAGDHGKLGLDIQKCFSDNEEADVPIISAHTLVNSSGFLSWVTRRDRYRQLCKLPNGTQYTTSDAMWALHEYEQRYHDNTEGGEQYLVDGMTTLQREALPYAQDLIDEQALEDVWGVVRRLYNECEGATFRRLVTLLFDVRDALRNWQYDELEIFNTDVV